MVCNLHSNNKQISISMAFFSFLQGFQFIEVYNLIELLKDALISHKRCTSINKLIT